MNTITNSRQKGYTPYLNSTIKIIFFSAVLYFLLAKLSQSIFINEINLPPFFPAIGFGTAFALFFGRRAIIGVAIGSFAFSINLYEHQIFHAINHQQFINTLIFCFLRPLIIAFNVFLVSHFTQLWCKTKYPFNKAIHILYFAIACLLGSIIAPSVGTILLAVSSYHSADSLLLIWSNLIRGNALGIILFTPFVLAFLNKSENKTSYSLLKKIEIFIVPFITIALSLYVFETRAHNESLLYLLLICAAYRFDFKIITTITLIIAVIAIYYTNQKIGAFVFGDWNDNFFMLQIFLFVNMVSILFLKAILKEKEIEKNKLKISEQNLGLERNILKASIENSNGICIFSLDTNLNYLSFNSAHEKYMKDHHGATIKIGDNHIELISWENKKEEFTALFHNVLKGNIYNVKEKIPTGEYWNISKSPIIDKNSKIIGITTIITNITDLKLKEIQLKSNNYTLNERIKELSCLYDISKILNKKSLSKHEKLQACAQIIPTALQFSEKANCRIQFRNQEFLSENYKKSDCQIDQKIIVNGKQCGSIEMGYFDTKNLKKENLFLEEEIKLLETLSGIISKSLQTKIAEDNLKKSEETYRLLFENVQDVFFKTSIKTKEILDVSPSCSTFNGITREELIGQNMSVMYTDHEKAQSMFHKIITEHKIVDHNNEIIIKGKSFYVSINAKIIFDSFGEPEFAIGSFRDITKRRLAEENLKISEEKFRNIYESSDDIYFKKQLDGLLLDVSPSIEKHLNLKREEVIGMNAFDFYVNRLEGEQFYQAILENRKVNDYEERFLTKTGEIIYFSVNAHVIYDTNGQPAYFEGTMRNINERILNRQKLQEVTNEIQKSEEKFRSIYENMQDIYYLHDLEGTILDVSPSIEKHFNEKREYFIGEQIKDFFVDCDLYNELLKEISRDGFINDKEIAFATPSGEKLFFSINSKLTNDENGQLTLVEGTMRNINDRIVNQKQLLEATEKIKVSEEKFRSIFENMEDVYYLHNLEGTILDISPSCEKYFKFKREELIGSNANVLFDDIIKQYVLREKLLSYKSINDEYVQFVSSTATGEPMHFSVNCKIIYDQNGEPIHVEGSMRNINERINNQNKLLEASEKIKESEEELRSIFESFEDLYFRIFLDGKIQNVSPSIEKILKFKREEIINTNASALYLNPEDRVRMINSLKEKGHINDFECVLKDKKGNPVYVSINTHLICDTEGNPMYSEGTIRDISQRKENELEIETANLTIKENEKKYRTIFESVRDVFFRASIEDHKIIDISPSCTYFDIQPEEIIGRSITEFYLNPEERTPVLNELKQNGEIKNYDIKLLLKSKIFSVSVNSKITLDENGNPKFLIGSFRDVTDRVQAEENLKISEAKFRSIYENFEDVYFRTSITGTILDLSPSFEKHFKKPRWKALEQPVFELYYDIKDRENLLESLKEKKQVTDFDARFKDSEGNIVFFSLNARIIYDENKNPLYIEGTMRNINERVTNQKEMIIKNRKLEFQNTELEQFAYIASHDLQEPLITVIHCISLLQAELGGNLDEDQKQYLEFINSSTSRMQVLVKGLLDYSRIGKERKKNTIDCNQIVSDVLADMKASLRESNAIIEYEKLPVIEGNTTEMRQLFQNLISNANKFRKKDQQPKIKIGAVKEENNWLFSIQDNGIGIKNNDVDKVFVIFKRLNNRDEYQGTGIGLSHCKKIIEQHRGKIWVESKFNEGSTFKWTFPIEQNLN